jgi:hypothetical protein
LFSFFEKCLHRNILVTENLVHAVNCIVLWLLIMQRGYVEKKKSEVLFV